MRFQILGAGAWGTALALMLGRNGWRVRLTPRDPAKAEELREAGENRSYLPGIRLEGIEVNSAILPPGAGQRVFVLASPSAGIREWSTRLKAELEVGGGPPPLLVSLAKGLEAGSLRWPSQILSEVFPDFPVFALSGPNFAQEVARGQPTAAVLAGAGFSTDLEALQGAMSSAKFRVYRSDDPAGVELGGSLKNVYAIGSGICEGLGLGENAKAALLTRSLNEMLRLVPRLNGRVETVYGLSGIGDLVATCYSTLSRNRTFGEAIGQGGAIRKSLEDGRGVVEGYFACANFHQLFKNHEINGPIIEQIYSVLYHEKSPTDALADLMARDLKPEQARPAGMV